MVRGDFGKSFYYRTPVLELYLSRLPSSLLLAAAAMIFSLVIGIPSGIIAAVSVGRFGDNAGKIFALLGLSMPQFWVGLLLILFFSVYLGWLPSSGSGTVWHLIMPAFALGWYFAAAHMRITRSSMLEVLGSEYVKLARLKGLPERRVIVKHALKNALIPVLTLAGINLVLMVNAAVVVETVFAWPGIGRLLYEGITFRDFPDRAGDRHARRRHDRRREPGGRRALRGHRPAHPVRALAMAVTRADRLTVAWRSASINLQGMPVVPVAILVGFALVAIFAGALAPHSAEVGNLGERFKPPAWQQGGTSTFLLGTDHLGRDVLSRLIFGARVSMVVGLLAVVVAGAVGTALGILSGYMGRWVDQVVMRVTDTWLALPALTFAIFLAAIVGPSQMEHRHHPVVGLLDTLRARHPRRGPVAQGARVRAPRDRGRLLEADDHVAPHPAERAEHRDRPRVAPARGGHRHRGDAVLPRRRRAAAASRRGGSCSPTARRA